MLTKTAVEQRKFPRIPFQRPIRFKPKSVVLFASHSAYDISQGGIRFNSDVFIPPGTVLTVQVKLADEALLLDMQGKVVWTKYVSHLQMYQMGLEFISDNSYSRWKIRHHVFNIK